MLSLRRCLEVLNSNIQGRVYTETEAKEIRKLLMLLASIQIEKQSKK